MKEARLPMGLRKDLHIKAITEIPEVRDRWFSVYGKYPDQGTVTPLFCTWIGDIAGSKYFLFIYFFVLSGSQETSIELSL